MEYSLRGNGVFPQSGEEAKVGVALTERHGRVSLRAHTLQCASFHGGIFTLWLALFSEYMEKVGRNSLFSVSKKTGNTL